MSEKVTVHIGTDAVPVPPRLILWLGTTYLASGGFTHVWSGAGWISEESIVENTSTKTIRVQLELPNGVFVAGPADLEPGQHVIFSRISNNRIYSVVAGVWGAPSSVSMKIIA